MSIRTVPVIIVGAGPTGLTLANLLGLYGIETVLLERNASTVHEPRAVSIDDEGLRVLEAVGLVDEAMVDMLVGGIRVTYVNGLGRQIFQVEPRTVEFGFPRISLIIQPRLERCLQAGLERFPHVEQRFQHVVDTLTQDEHGVTVRGHGPAGAPFELRASYLIGCDGGRSLVRNSLGIPLKGRTYSERWLVVDTLEHGPESREVVQICDRERPAVSVPGRYGHRRWEFMLRPGESEEEISQCENVLRLIGCHGDPDNIQLLRKTVYTFHARNAARYQSGRMFLAGDAAHLMPPFAGQGVSSGLRDVHNLGWKLAAVLRGQGSPRLLETYDQERRRSARRMIQLATRLGRLAMTTKPTLAFARDTFFSIVSRSDAAQAYVREARLKPKPRYKQGFLWRHPSRGAGTGQMLAQPMVRTVSGQRERLDHVLGDGFALVGLGRDPRQALSGCETAWKSLAPRFVQVVSGTALPAEAPLEVVSDEDGLLTSLARKGRSLLLVRPDRFIAAHFREDQAALVARSLRAED